MKYVNLGNAGIKVSILGIGTWHLPGSGKYNDHGIEYVDKQTFSKIFKMAYDSGINFFDTANIYHGRVEHNEDCIECTGNSEKTLGEIIKDYERESLVISTKVRGPMAGYVNSSGLSRKHIMNQIRESLNRLNTDYIDLYQFHWSDNEVSLLETLKTMSHIIDMDYARYIGMSNVNASDISDFMYLSEIHNLNSFSTIQEPYNVLNRGIEDSKLITAKKYNLGLLAYTPLDQGILTGKYLINYDRSSRIYYYPELKTEIERTEKKVKHLKELADNKGITLSQLSIAWLLKMSEKLDVKIIPLLGITKLQHLTDNLEALNVNLKDEDIKYMNEL
ncbi:MAG: aldo/keto reductase [Candidatus Thermoplasmatota archaeon]|nr:aldo/keto reductase [Candidatus Thermoplasmatota archaeon]